ncbi:MAG: ATP-dependent helicase [Ruminococcus sp.]|nr:ATP-dependent helicase [Ruminococcus sp.]
MSEKRYTQSQQDAIDWGEGAVIILAGPGSGKTAVLTERIIRLLKETERESFRILALTFTNKAATEMSERIAAGIDNQEKRLFIGTFHSFCSEVLRNHGSYVNIKSDFEIYSSNEDLNAVVNEIKAEYGERYSEDEISELNLLNAVQYFEKRLCLTEGELDAIMPKTSYQRAFKWVYFRYIEKMLELNVLDFDMLILLTYKLFKEYPSVARIYRSMYRYINIDEFQDTNYGQYTLVKTLCGTKHNNLFIVADDDQVIYGWNGASHERINEFRNDFHAELIQLYQNFRCPKEVVNLANKLIAHNIGRTKNKKPLEAMKVMEDAGKQHIILRKYSDYEIEIDGVTDLILEIQGRYPSDSICVLARTNRLLDRAFQRAADKKIDCVKSKRKDEFEMPYVLLIYDMLKLANHRNDKKVLQHIAVLVNSIIGKSVNWEEVIMRAEITDGDLLKALCGSFCGLFEDDDFEKSIMLNLCEGKNFLRYVEDAFNWSDKHINMISEREVREQLLSEYESEKVVWRDFQRNLGYVHNLDEMTISTYMQEFSMASKEGEPRKENVQFLTIHAAKGKEFDNVIIMGMVNDELPSFQSLKKGANCIELEEERRNCFVAITRAKKRLFMTYSEKYFGWKKNPSQFLTEMFQ